MSLIVACEAYDPRSSNDSKKWQQLSTMNEQMRCSFDLVATSDYNCIAMGGSMTDTSILEYDVIISQYMSICYDAF
jgi:hypothetical protein